MERWTRLVGTEYCSEFNQGLNLNVTLHEPMYAKEEPLSGGNC